MQFLKVTENEKSIYNDFVYNSSFGSFYQLYEWGEIKQKTGWKPLYFMVKHNDNIIATILILKKKLPAINKHIFYAPRGPVCDLADVKTLKFIWNNINTLAKLHKAVLLKIDPQQCSSNQTLHTYLIKNSFQCKTTQNQFQAIQPRIVYQLKLNKSKEQLLANMSSKTRYNIRYAQKNGVTVKVNCDLNDLKRFYGLLKVTGSRGGFTVRDYQYYEDLYNNLIKNGYGKLFIAEYEGQAVAGALSFICSKSVYYCYGASDNKFRNKQPNALMQWSMIKWAHDSGCDIYDFGGVVGYNDESHPLYGIYRFKKGFAGEVTEFLGEYDLVFSKGHYYVWDNIVPIILKWRKRIAKISASLLYS